MADRGAPKRAKNTRKSTRAGRASTEQSLIRACLLFNCRGCTPPGEDIFRNYTSAHSTWPCQNTLFCSFSGCSRAHLQLPLIPRSSGVVAAVVGGFDEEVADVLVVDLQDGERDTVVHLCAESGYGHVHSRDSKTQTVSQRETITTTGVNLQCGEQSISFLKHYQAHTYCFCGSCFQSEARASSSTCEQSGHTIRLETLRQHFIYPKTSWF